MVGWHHQLDGQEFEKGLGVGDKQGNLVCCSSWGCKELDRAKLLKQTELNLKFAKIEDTRKVDAYQTWSNQENKTRRGNLS